MDSFLFPCCELTAPRAPSSHLGHFHYIYIHFTIHLSTMVTSPHGVHGNIRKTCSKVNVSDLAQAAYHVTVFVQVVQHVKIYVYTYNDFLIVPWPWALY